jgi:SAM-dependent methyltransferase
MPAINYQCVGCGADQVECLLDLGGQPPSNRYLNSPDAISEQHPLRFGVCARCGLAQLIDPMPASVAHSRFSWIAYNEPEGHLDNLVDRIEALGLLGGHTFAVGVTYKDDTTLARCQRKGVGRTHRLSQTQDLRIADPLSSLETIQARLNLALADELVKKYGQADVLFVRHILEHAHEPKLLIEACRRLARPGGLLVFEVPDCRKVFDGNDHCFLWEEHIVYFTPETLKGFLRRAGFQQIDILVYSYPMEDSLVAIVVNDDLEPGVDVQAIEEEIYRARNFAVSFHARKTAIQRMLDAWRKQGHRLALFGAGHLAAKFVNFYQLKDRFIGVIDDNPNKQKHYLPGSALPVISSTCLETGEVDICLLTLSPESEARVRKAKAEYLARGGVFRSIFSASGSSIDKDLIDDPA